MSGAEIPQDEPTSSGLAGDPTGKEGRLVRVVVLGAGISGHTAAAFARRWLDEEHEVVVVSPNQSYNWIPSNVWVGVGLMSQESVKRPLRPIYDRAGIAFEQALATSLHPEGDGETVRPFVRVRYTDPAREGGEGAVPYDFLVNATGRKLNSAATPGLGPEGHSQAISKPMKTPDGFPVFPAPPRTGMPAETIGKAVARNVVGLVGGAPKPKHSASMARMGAACTASAGASPFTGTATSMTVFPIVPDFERYPEYGRDTSYTFGEIGLAGHRIKHILHLVLLYKAQLESLWHLIPE